MNGRNIFKKLGKLINFTALLISFIPRSLRLWMLRVNRNTGGNYGVFIRYLLIKYLAKKCGNNVSIKQYVILENIDRITFGNNISIHPFCYFEGKGEIEIQDDVSVAHNTSVISTNHTWESSDFPIKYNPVSLEKVTISEGVWIGCGCRILAGVTVGNRSVVAAGAVVNKNVENHEIVGGVPAKHIKFI